MSWNKYLQIIQSVHLNQRQWSYLLRDHRSWKQTSFWKEWTWEGWGWRGYRLGSHSNTALEPTLLPAEHCVPREKIVKGAGISCASSQPDSSLSTRRPGWTARRGEHLPEESRKQSVVWPEITNVVEATGSVCAPHDLQTKGRLQVSDLQQHQRQVLNKQQRVHQRNRISHDAPVVGLLRLQHPHAVKKPIRCYEKEE